MFKQSKEKSELTEDRVREIFEEEYKQTVKDIRRASEDTARARWQDIKLDIENIVNRELEDIVAEQVKYIEDKLLVELARQAMALDKDKNTQTIYS